MLKKVLIVAALGVLSVPSALVAQSSTAAAQGAAAQRITIEYYYRVKWGSLGEFKRLYEKNHAPLLREMQKAGFITAIRADEPFTHMAGGVRWDYRVTITYRDPASAVVADGEFQRQWDESEKRLYPDRKTFEAEEARRFSLLEEHWDVVL